MNLSRAVQLCVDIGAHLIADLDVPPPDTMGKTFDTLRDAGVSQVFGPGTTIAEVAEYLRANARPRD